MRDFGIRETGFSRILIPRVQLRIYSTQRERCKSPSRTLREAATRSGSSKKKTRLGRRHDAMTSLLVKILNNVVHCF